MNSNNPEKKNNKQKKVKKELDISVVPFHIYRAVAVCIMICACALTVVRTLSLAGDFDPDIQYFRVGAALPMIFRVAAIALTVCAFVLPLLVSKKKLPDSACTNSNPATALTALLAALALAAATVVEVRTIIQNRSQAVVPFAAEQGFTQRLNTISVPLAIFAAIAAIYLVMCALETKVPAKVRVAVGFGAVAFFVCRLLALYYDTSSPINSPIKMLDQLSYAFAMLFVVNELRAAVGEYRSRNYFQTGVTAFLLMLPSSVSQVIYSLRVPTINESQGLFPLFEIAFSLYIGARLLTALFAKPVIVPEPVDFADGSKTDDQITNDSEDNNG